MEKEQMTLRDQFAMAAMNGLLSDSPDDCLGYEFFANDAYEIADAMLKAREVNNEN